MITRRVLVCLAGLAGLAAAAARPLQDRSEDLVQVVTDIATAVDPFDDASLPPSVRVAIEYIAYYLATACAPLTD